MVRSAEIKCGRPRRACLPRLLEVQNPSPSTELQHAFRSLPVTLKWYPPG